MGACRSRTWRFLGGLIEAENHTALTELGIDRVVNMAPEAAGCGPSTRRHYPEHFETLDLDAKDADEYDIFECDVPQALKFIERCHADGRKVLVHCYAGMNRSATVCA